VDQLDAPILTGQTARRLEPQEATADDRDRPCSAAQRHDLHAIREGSKIAHAWQPLTERVE
jgi:hypothetical protein